MVSANNLMARILVLAGSVVLGAPGWSWAQHGGAMRLGVVSAERREVPATLTLVGSVQPETRSAIATEVEGIVRELLVDEGDKVVRGTVLCRLRDTVRRLGYEQAASTLSQLQAQLAELEAGTRKEEIERARAAKEEAKALLQKWESELVRVKELRERASASLKEYNDTVAEHAAAQARLDQATAAYELAVAGPRKEEIERAHYAVEAQKVLVEKWKYDFDQTVIRAPFAGYITRKYVEVGQWVTAGGDVVELIDLEHVLVRVNVPESAISSAKVGELVPVNVEALGRTFDGKIKHVIPQADEKARTFPVEVELNNASGVLKSGMFVRAVVPAGPTEDSILVPRDALVQRGPTQYVVMVAPSPMGQGQMAMPVPVQMGATAGAWVAVKSPMLQAGVPVAVKGHDRVFVPMPAEPVPADVPPLPPGLTTTQPAASAPAPR